MKKKMSWLVYSQIVLKKVSFDPEIFRKEFKKALKRLSKSEILKLESWCINNFELTISMIAVTLVQEYLFS